MLKNLLNSRLKKKILMVLSANPLRSYGVTELQEMLRVIPRTIRQTLYELVDGDIVNVANRKNKQYFRINQYFPFFEEIANLVSDKKSKSDDLVFKALKKLDKCKLIILTGIFTHQPHLEVDLLFVGDRMSLSKLNVVLDELERLIGQEINFTRMTLEEFQYRKVMNDKFIRDIMDNPHLFAVNNLKKKNDIH